ncbi:hypothetical protein [Breznakia pachnodae]|uniref:DUF4352 domain-containing protein n=1 Tax=Breznakia pachnodae TaxID=265178 RepID=A0ABU0DXR2_9FIRM|nr:hypothetical protein [Breznakia pachnodae]MDQ0359427.1 hypothetical protein [Breznakia pachnodae]
MKRLLSLLLVFGLFLTACGGSSNDSSGPKEFDSKSANAVAKVFDKNGYEVTFQSSDGFESLVYSSEDNLDYFDVIATADGEKVYVYGDLDAGYIIDDETGVYGSDSVADTSFACVFNLEKEKTVTGYDCSDDDKKELETIKTRYHEWIEKYEINEKDIKKHLDNVFDEAKAENEIKNKAYGLGETVEYSENGDVKFTLTINSVTSTEERNQFDDSNPAQVIKINYTYENINDEDGVYIFSSYFTVIDEGGNVCDAYPISGEYPKDAPIGAKATADEAYGLKQASGTIKLRFNPTMFGDEYINFELPVQ